MQTATVPSIIAGSREACLAAQGDVSLIGKRTDLVSIPDVTLRTVCWQTFVGIVVGKSVEVRTI